MGSTEVTVPPFVVALRSSCLALERYTDRQVASWIVARLNYLTSGALSLEGEHFAHDTNEFGYKLKITDNNNHTIASGAVVIHENRTYFKSVNVQIDDFQTLFVKLLTEYPEDLAIFRIRVRDPESKRIRVYEWDGYSLPT